MQELFCSRVTTVKCLCTDTAPSSSAAGRLLKKHLRSCSITLLCWYWAWDDAGVTSSDIPAGWPWPGLPPPATCPGPPSALPSNETRGEMQNFTRRENIHQQERFPAGQKEELPSKDTQDLKNEETEMTARVENFFFFLRTWLLLQSCPGGAQTNQAGSGDTGVLFPVFP